MLIRGVIYALLVQLGFSGFYLEGMFFCHPHFLHLLSWLGDFWSLCNTMRYFCILCTILEFLKWNSVMMHKYFSFHFMCMSVFAYMHVCTPCLCQWRSESFGFPGKLSYRWLCATVGARTWTWVLWKTKQCSLPLISLSSLMTFLLCSWIWIWFTSIFLKTVTSVFIKDNGL